MGYSHYITALDSLIINHTATYITEVAIQKSSTPPRLFCHRAVLLTSRTTIGFTAINMVPMWF